MLETRLSVVWLGWQMSPTLAQGKAEVISQWKTGVSRVQYTKSKFEMVKHVKIYTKCEPSPSRMLLILISFQKASTSTHRPCQWKQKLLIRKLRSLEMRRTPKHMWSSAYVEFPRDTAACVIQLHTHRHMGLPTRAQKQNNQQTNTTRQKNEP